VPEVEYTTTLNLPRETVWDFVKDMNNWAPFLTGYQRHEILSETDSIWTLKGDVGVLARVVKLKAHVTDWSGPDRVAFTLTGLNEPVEGGGELVMREGAVAPAGTSTAVVKVSFVRRMLDAFARFLFKLVNGRSSGRTAPAPTAGRPARAGEGSRLTFTLRMEAGGPTGPLVNAMLAPALGPAAEDLANRIAEHLEKAHAA
jgi:carbon monoxide dehydrogenase subunit G